MLLWLTWLEQLVRTMEGHADGVNAVAVSSDGRFVYSGSQDKTVKQWEASSGAVRGSVCCCCCCWCVTWLAQLIWTMKGHSNPVNAVAVSPDGRFVYSGSQDETVKQWEASSGAVC